MFIKPMLLESRQEAFNDTRYIFEPKIDGHRLILSLQDGKVRMYTRHNNECTRQYPELHNVPVDGDVVLDGEVARFDEDGNVDFEGVMERFRMTKPATIRAAAGSKPVNFVVFDILSYKGDDLRSRPLMERKAILDIVLTENNYYTKISYIDEHGEAFNKIIKQRNMEGSVAKLKNSRYVSRRSESWLKIVNYQMHEVYIAGYRKEQFGWLAHVKENGQLRPGGIIELAVPSSHKKAFHSVAESIVSGEDRNFVYVEPKLRAKVTTRGWTKNRMLRTPAFVDFII